MRTNIVIMLHICEKTFFNFDPVRRDFWKVVQRQAQDLHVHEVVKMHFLLNTMPTFLSLYVKMDYSAKTCSFRESYSLKWLLRLLSFEVVLINQSLDAVYRFSKNTYFALLIKIYRLRIRSIFCRFLFICFIILAPFAQKRSI